MISSLILLQAGGGGGGLSLIFPLLILAVFYFFMIRPQQQKQKAQTNFANELEKGMEVATASGIIGKINKVDDAFVTLQVDTKTFIKFTRSAISKEMTEAIRPINSNEKTDKS